jgi:hypothetical protein
MCSTAVSVPLNLASNTGNCGGSQFVYATPGPGCANNGLFYNPPLSSCSQNPAYFVSAAGCPNAQLMQMQTASNCPMAAAIIPYQRSSCGSSGATLFNAGNSVQGAFMGTGPLAPNTYTYTTLRPKYGATMGTIFEALQPSTSSRLQFAGQFGGGSNFGNPRCA